MRQWVHIIFLVSIFLSSISQDPLYANGLYPLTLVKINDRGSFILRFTDPMTGLQEQFQLNRRERPERDYFEYQVTELSVQDFEVSVPSSMNFLESKTLLLSEDMIREVLLELRSAAVDERSTFEFDAQGVFKKSGKRIRLDWNRGADPQPVMRRLMVPSLIAGFILTTSVLPDLTSQVLGQPQSLPQSMISGLGVAGAAGVSIFGGPLFWLVALYNRTWGPKLAYEFSEGRLSHPIPQIVLSGVVAGGIGSGMIACASMIAKAAAGQ